MRSSSVLLNPTSDKALVRFMRLFMDGLAINVLDGEKVIGNSVAKSQFDYLADPGKHLFIGTTFAQNNAFLETELEAGKTYYIITWICRGAWKGRVAFVSVNKGSKFWDKVNEYESTLKKLEPDIASLKSWEEQNKQKIQKILSDYESVWKDKYQWPKLMPEDGR